MLGFTIRSTVRLSDEDIDHYRAILDRPRVKPGECTHPECTGVHSHTRPRSEWCPRTLELDREFDSSMQRSLYKYLWALRTSIDAAEDRIAELGFERSTDRSHWEKPLPSGARDVRLRTIVEGARGRRLNAVATDAT